MLLSHVMKVLERILDGRIRKSVEMEIGEEQQGFRKSRVMKDGMFALRQLVEKRFGGARWDGVGICGHEQGLRHCPDTDGEWDTEMDESARSRMQVGGRDVRWFVGPRMSEEFSVNISLRQGSSLSPLMFIMVMELISRKVNMRGILGRMLYSDDQAVTVESRWETQEVLGEWKEAFGKHGLKIIMEKTEVMWVWQQKK